MWMSGVVYRHGLAGMWYGFFAAWCAVSAFISTRIFRRSLAYSQAEWQTLRFSGLGSELLRGWMAGWQVFMNMMILGWVGKIPGASVLGPGGQCVGCGVCNSACRINAITRDGKRSVLENQECIRCGECLGDGRK